MRLAVSRSWNRTRMPVWAYMLGRSSRRKRGLLGSLIVLAIAVTGLAVLGAVRLVSFVVAFGQELWTERTARQIGGVVPAADSSCPNCGMRRSPGMCPRCGYSD